MFIYMALIGIVVNSLKKLEEKLAHLTTVQYNILLTNTITTALRLKEGYYLKQALKKCEKIQL